MWYILYRDPKSLLVEDWKVMGSAPTKGFENAHDANAALKRLGRNMYYDCILVRREPCAIVQGGSRSDLDCIDI